MKYRTLAFAALTAAGAAHAQSTATLFGTVDANVYHKQFAGETATNKQDSGGLTTSFWGLRGTEDLGNGLRANFMLASFFRADVGGAGRSDTDPFFARSAWVGVADNTWGALRLGRITTEGMLNLQRFSAFVDSSGFGPSLLHNYMPSAVSPMMTGSGSTGVGDSGWSNALSYTSPTLGGAVGSLMVSAGEGTAVGRRIGGSLLYTGGPFSAGLVLENIDKASLNFSKPPAIILMTTSRLANAGVSYDLQVVKLFGQYIRTKLSNATTEITLATKQLSASVPVSTGYVLAAFARTDKAQTAAADQKRETFSLGYDYFLSKRTDLYAVAMNDRVTALKSGTGYAVGIRHRF